MARAASVMPLRLARRMCLSCGFDGRAIQNHSRETEWVCPRCGSDLYARPPKSYAELEALSDSNPGTFIDVSPRECGGRSRALGRLVGRTNLAWVILTVFGAASLFMLGVWLGRTL